MEYLIFALSAVFFIVIIMAIGWIQEKEQERLFRQRLHTEYGVLPRREYQAEQFANIARYFNGHQTGFVIDDITWNDLDMDELFRQMNHTYSSVGEEYLYYALRSPLTDAGALKEREAIIAFFQNSAAERVAWQFLFAKLGRTGKYSIYDYLNYLDGLGIRSNRRHYLGIVAFAVAVASLFLSVSLGVGLMMGVLIINVTTYFNIKKSIDPYITSFSYIFRLLHSIKRMEKNRVPLLQKQIDEMADCRAAFQKFSRGSWLLMSSSRMSASGNPLEIIVDYLRMGFHLDLIKFNQMLSQVRRHQAEIDRILTVAGSIEAMIAIGAWRENLRQNEYLGYTVPEFCPASAIKGAGVYHPFLTEPVKNDFAITGSVLLTGSNASGKSTFLKMVALNGILAQTAHTCLAAHYQTGMFYVATSMSLRDDIRGGDSYYMAEIKAMKRLMDLAGEGAFPVLVLVDEVLRGTNTVERIAASTQILRSLNGKNSICFAATHDIELTYLLEKEYQNYHFEEEFNEGDIYFPYRLLPGPATTRNAIKLLQVMGYDGQLIADAERMAAGFFDSGKWQLAGEEDK